MWKVDLVLLAALVVVAASAPNTADNRLRFESFENLLNLPSVDKLWADFKIKHKKEYSTDNEEKQRKDIFGEHLKKIELHNYLHAKGEKSYRLGINEYADLEHREFVAIMNGFVPRPAGQTPNHDRTTYMSPLTKFQMPKEVDWRNSGYVTDVKNQGHCGSCWSFSATGSLEGQHFRRTGRLVSLSEQNLVDCSAAWGNNGCNGGLMDNAFQYIKDNDGLDTEMSYPYQAKQKKCHFKTRNIGATDVGYTDVPSGDEDKLKEALATVGPVSVAIDASHSSFQLYESGVYDEPECSNTALDHGVLTVGYGTSEEGDDYWIVKNSWGPTWGESGYVRMTRNKDNQCGVATQASFPLV